MKNSLLAFAVLAATSAIAHEGTKEEHKEVTKEVTETVTHEPSESHEAK
tara:strand:- start:414 stop:560 length:147 start_codon:yes stop_codon:yes gene_type:complete